MTEREKKRIEKMAIEAIEANKLTTISEVCVYLPIHRATFYNNGFDKLDTIKSAIETNKLKIKQSLRAKWYKSDQPTLQVALYKLLSTPEELAALSGGPRQIDVTSGGERISGFTYITPDDSDNQTGDTSDT